MKEIWLNIKGYEGKYQVSNFGRVKSLNYNNTGKERILSAGKDKKGYLLVVLCKDGKPKPYKVHRLVAQAFIPNSDGLPEVNHRDECKTNNVVSNLEWCSHKYNTNYGTGHERSAKANTNHPNTSKPVYQYTLDGSLVRSYPSLCEVRRKTGYSQGSISECCNGKQKYHNGYIWSYNLLTPKGKLF